MRRAANADSSGRRDAWLGCKQVLGVIFTFGIMVTDGASGLWTARLMRGDDVRALVVSRIIGLAIAFVSLAIESAGLAKYCVPKAATIVESAGLLPDFSLVAVLLASYTLAVRLSRPT